MSIKLRYVYYYYYFVVVFNYYKYFGNGLSSPSDICRT